MLQITTSLLLLSIYCLFPIAAITVQGEMQIQCLLRNPEKARNPTGSFSEDCSAALRLIPYTGYHLSPDFMQRHYGGPEKPISLDLFSKDKVAGKDKIRLPALFIVRSCMILVLPMADLQPPEGTKVASMLFNHFWPGVHEGVIKVWEQCIRREEPRGGIMRTDLLMQADNWSFRYLVKVDVKPEQLSRETIWADYNIYTPAGQINDIRWSIPFQPPSRHLQGGPGTN